MLANKASSTLVPAFPFQASTSISPTRLKSKALRNPCRLSVALVASHLHGPWDGSLIEPMRDHWIGRVNRIDAIDKHIPEIVIASLAQMKLCFLGICLGLKSLNHPLPQKSKYNSLCPLASP